MADREALIRETHRLNHEIGYTGFRLQYFNDPEAIKEWPDPALRERELRSFGTSRRSKAIPLTAPGSHIIHQELGAYRDRLAAKLAGNKLDHVDYYSRASERYRRARFQAQDKDKDLGR